MLPIKVFIRSSLFLKLHPYFVESSTKHPHYLGEYTAGFPPIVYLPHQTLRPMKAAQSVAWNCRKAMKVGFNHFLTN